MLTRIHHLPGAIYILTFSCFYKILIQTTLQRTSITYELMVHAGPYYFGEHLFYTFLLYLQVPSFLGVNSESW